MNGFRNFLFFTAVTAVVLFFLAAPDSVSALSRLGSQGSEVRSIQTRLKSWGYYSGAVDGIYGSSTKSAVLKFQRKNGLTADGVAGPATLAAIGISPSSSSSDSNVDLLARLINGEARGESYVGQVAVGAVVMNRIRHPSFSNTMAGVIYQPQAFTAVSDGQIHAAVEASCYRAARDAINGWDPTGGAIYYYNPRTATNAWIRSRPVVATIGKHIFCK